MAKRLFAMNFWLLFSVGDEKHVHLLCGRGMHSDLKKRLTILGSLERLASQICRYDIGCLDEFIKDGDEMSGSCVCQKWRFHVVCFPWFFPYTLW